MRTLSILLAALLLFCPYGASAVDNPIEGSRISEIAEGQHSYNYFNYRPELSEFFDSKGLQGGGYTWESLAKAGLAITKSRFASLIEFDPEGDALFAYSASRAALEELESIVKRIASDPEFRAQCLAFAEQSGELE